METIGKKLIKLGLSDKEARVYLAALELGEASIAALVKKSKVKRSTVVFALDRLKEKSLVSMSKRKNRTLFIAESPVRIEEMVDEKKVLAREMIPGLMSLASFLEKKPKMKYFEGETAITEVYNDLLKFTKQEILTWFPNDTYYQKEKYLLEFFIPRRVENNIWIKAISPDSKKMRQININNEKEMRQIKFISEEKFINKNEILIYGNSKIAIISYVDEIGIIIESKNIYEAMKSMFNIMWESL